MHPELELQHLLKKIKLYEIVLITILLNKLLQRMNTISKCLQNVEFFLSTTVYLLQSPKFFIQTEIRLSFNVIEKQAAILIDGNCIYHEEQQ